MELGFFCFCVYAILYCVGCGFVCLSLCSPPPPTSTLHVNGLVYAVADYNESPFFIVVVE